MKKTAFLCFLVLLLCLTACASGEETPAPSQAPPVSETRTDQTEPAEEPEAPTRAKEDCREQLALFADCRGRWIRSDPKVYYNYAVTDLDQNGAPELIVTACMGENQSSSTELWEISGDGTEILCAAWGGDYASTADLAVNTARVFYDGSTDTYTYIFSDAMGGAETAKRACVLKNGTLTETLLCSQRAGKCYDARGEEITQEEYDHMEDTACADQLPLTARFLWQAPFHDEIEVLSRDDWYGMLESSWQAFQLQ